MPAKFRKAASANKPLTNAYFGLEIKGIQEASFSTATGISAEVETFEYQEGGTNQFEYKMPTRTKYSNVTLERGVTKSTELLRWFDQVKEGIVLRKEFSVILWNSTGEEMRRWTFKNGYPVKWKIGDLDAMSNQILIETIELAHEGFSES